MAQKETKELTAADLIRGHTYEAKNPAPSGFPRLVNDRQLIYVGRGTVQYDDYRKWKDK